MNNYGIIIQARLESKRLPEKIIKPIYQGLSILDLITTRLRKAQIDGPMILATGDYERNKKLREVADRLGLVFFAGSENDVLSRFVECGTKYHLKKIIRICCDNPFLDIGLINDLISRDGNFDYVSYEVDKKPTILSHYGFFSEMISMEALSTINSMTDLDPLDREHVTRYIYMNPEKFRINYIPCPSLIEQSKNVRLTVDTAADFENARLVLAELLNGSNDLSYTYKEVLISVKKTPRIQSSMQKQIAENSK